MTLGSLLVLTLILLAPPQRPGTEPKPAIKPAPARAAIVRRPVAPGQPLLAAPAPAFRQQISKKIGGKLVQMEPKPEPIGEDGDDAPPAAPMLVLNVQDMAFSRENFDRLLFADNRGETARRAKLHSLLDERIEAAGRIRKLTEAERKTLRLAGTGDIEHFIGRVEAAREDFEANRLDYTRGWDSLNRLEPLAREYARGPFEARSLFAKTSTRLTIDAWASPFRLGGGIEDSPR